MSDDNTKKTEDDDFKKSIDNDIRYIIIRHLLGPPIARYKDIEDKIHLKKE